MKKLKRFLLLTILAAAMFALTGCGSQKVSLNKYITIEAKGYDGMGTASYKFDYAAFEKDYAGKIKATKEYQSQAHINIPDNNAPSSLIENCISGRLDKKNGLKNGDEITLHWDCDDEKAESMFNCKLNYSDIKYTVKDLEEVARFDPFEYVTVSFSGISPNGTVKIEKDSSKAAMDMISFAADRSSGLVEGDTVLVTGTISISLESFAEEYGEIPSRIIEEYTVEGLSHYVTDANEISSDLMSEMTSQGEDAFRAYTARKWAHPENLISVSPAGNYFLSAKPGADVKHQNYLYLIYRISALNPDPEQTVDFYYYVCFHDILQQPDGTCTADLSGYEVPEAGGWLTEGESFEVGRFVYAGYLDLDLFVNKRIMSQIDQYKYTTTFGQ